MNKLLLNQRQQESTPQNNSNNNNCSLSPACFDVIRVSLPLSLSSCVCVFVLCATKKELSKKTENTLRSNYILIAQNVQKLIKRARSRNNKTKSTKV